MEKNMPFPAFTEADIKKVLGSPEGQALLQMLNKDGGTMLRQAAAAVRSGDMEKAKRLVQPVMESRDAAALIEKINQK